jgi:GH35 family endo-1,4-beta-xylanase
MKQLFLGMAVLATLATAGQAANCAAPGSMTSVRTYKSGNRDIVEFKIKSPVTYTKSITAETGPFTFGESDEVVPVKGSLFTRVHFQTLDWTCETPNTFSVKPVVKDVKLVERFEGYITYIIGRKAGSHYLGATDVACGSSRCVRVKFGP